MDNSNYIAVADFAGVGLLARHCSLDKLAIAIEQAKQFDLTPLFCYDLIYDALENWELDEINPNKDKYNKLINGCDYVDFNGKRQYNAGIKNVWVNYAYSRYLLINHYNDTASGTVKKDFDFSVGATLAEVKDISNSYKNMGKIAYEGVHSFLCNNQSEYPLFDGCNCTLSCGCSGKCTCGKTKKTTGLNIINIDKYNDFDDDFKDNCCIDNYL